MTREEWIDEIKERLAAGEEALELTIEKYRRALDGETLHMGYHSCPLCQVFWVEIKTESECAGCPIDKVGENCIDSGSLEKRLWKLSDNPALHDCRDDFIADTVIPFLEGLRGE